MHIADGIMVNVTHLAGPTPWDIDSNAQVTLSKIVPNNSDRTVTAVAHIRLCMDI